MKTIENKIQKYRTKYDFSDLKQLVQKNRCKEIDTYILYCSAYGVENCPKTCSYAIKINKGGK